nr:hypothetical protein [Roseateles oligotrophus]
MLANFQTFDFESANAKLHQCERDLAAATAALQGAHEAESGLESEIELTEPKLRIGFNPRTWFAPERTIARRHVEQLQKSLSAQKQSVEDLKSRKLTAERALREAKSEIDRVRKFDPLLAQAAIDALQKVVDRTRPRLDAIRARNEDLVAAIAGPVRQLNELQLELNRVQDTIRRCKAFKVALENSFSRSDKWRTHEECEQAFNDRDPNAVLGRSQFKQTKLEELVGKVEKQVKGLIKTTTTIEHFVIDGNNLCYDHGTLFGTAALDVLVPAISQRYRVTLMFDSSIRYRLSTNQKALAARYERYARVHICRNKREADEIILLHAEAPRSAVISNDQYREWASSRAVVEERVLSYELVGDKLYVPALKLSLDVDRSQDVRG